MGQEASFLTKELDKEKGAREDSAPGCGWRSSLGVDTREHLGKLREEWSKGPLKGPFKLMNHIPLKFFSRGM